MLHFSKNASSSDLAQRYSDTFILANGEIFYVTEASTSGFSGISPLTGERTEHSLDSLSSFFPRLGYVDLPTPRFLTRLPVRFYKQGICDRNISAPNFRINSILDSKQAARAVQSMLENKYKPFKASKVSTGAISKNFAASKGRLMFRGHEVGGVDNAGIKLLPKFKYLKELLDVERT